jgi:nitroimidazol reductase NimA-like FMN-containing flavoprotein (pyridoxamine 5'-phosphate oxidase superfamily)
MVGHLPDRPLVLLAAPEALELVASASVGRIVHVLDDRLCVVPINFRLERQDVLMRTADGTELLAAARRQAPAALQVDNIVDWSRSGWSVLIRGHLAEVTDPHAIERVLSSDLRPWSGGDRDHVVRLSGNEVTGRRIEPGPGVISVVRL